MRKPLLKLLFAVTVSCLAGCADMHGGGVGAGSDRRSFQEVSDDFKITSEINSSFFQDELIHTLRIDVDTHRGVVTLNGHADDQEEASRAIEISLNTPGVKYVISNLIIKNQAMSPLGVVYRKAVPEVVEPGPASRQPAQN